MKTTPTLKTADSMKAAAAMLKLPLELLQQAKAEGCTAFRGTRVHLAELSAWVKQDQLDQDADWLARAIKALSRDKASNRRGTAEELARKPDFAGFDVSEIIEQLELDDEGFLADLNLKFIRDLRARAVAAGGDLERVANEMNDTSSQDTPPSTTPPP